MRDAHRLVREWMTGAGMICRLDPATNLIGRRPARTAGPGAEQVVIIGSHLDSVVNAGRYDGPLGVLMGIALVEMAEAAALELPFALDVVAFCEEEGVRYQAPFIGSSALAGNLTAEHLAARDAAGVTLEQAIREFGGDPAKLADAVYPAEGVIAYIEPHIEQGLSLEANNLPIGVVTGIAGQSRAGVAFIGQAGHAGTVPMAARRDALTAAAEWISDVERIALAEPGLVATVGRLELAPNVANVIPAMVSLSLDVRHLDDNVRQDRLRRILDSAVAVARRRSVSFDVAWSHEQETTPCDPRLVDEMCSAVRDVGVRLLPLASGAGHDGVALARKFPIAMLFVRCAGGVSHHPSESVAEQDVAVALEALERLIARLADRRRVDRVNGQ